MVGFVVTNMCELHKLARQHLGSFVFFLDKYQGSLKKKKQIDICGRKQYAISRFLLPLNLCINRP